MPGKLLAPDHTGSELTRSVGPGGRGPGPSLGIRPRGSGLYGAGRAGPKTYHLGYRMGDCEAAVRELERAISLHSQGGSPQDWLVLAMAYHRLSRTEEAYEALGMISRRRNRAPAGTALAEKGKVSWETKIESKLLREEAEKLLAIGPLD